MAESTDQQQVRQVFEDYYAGMYGEQDARYRGPIDHVLENGPSGPVQRRNAIAGRVHDAFDLRRGIDRLANHA